MSATDARYARQVLLGEIGRSGQETLSAARYRIAEGTDERVARVVRTYLDRAGLAQAEAGRDVNVAVARSYGLTNDFASAYLAGALASVEHIKAELGLGVGMRAHVKGA